MKDFHEISPDEAVADVANSILEAVGRSLKTHGNDPLCIVVLAGGFDLAITMITDKFDPSFREQVIALLSHDLA